MAEVRWADPSAVEAAAADWTPGQIECRLFNKHNYTLRMTVGSMMRNGNMQLRSECSRRCGAYRVADFNRNMRQLSQWGVCYDTRLGKRYLLVDDHGRSIGRIGEEGRQVLWRMVRDGLRIIEVDDDG